MSLFTEAGIFAYPAFLVFVVGIVLIVRRPQSGARIGALGAAAALALGLTGAGLGQRLVDRAVSAEPDLTRKVEMLSLGTREAAANELLAGLFALTLAGLGAGVQRARDKEQA